MSVPVGELEARLASARLELERAAIGLDVHLPAAGRRRLERAALSFRAASRAARNARADAAIGAELEASSFSEALEAGLRVAAELEARGSCFQIGRPEDHMLSREPLELEARYQARELEACRPVISEAEAERRADAAVLAAMRTDLAYRHAESLEAQQEAEDAISVRVWAELEARYRIE